MIHYDSGKISTNFNQGKDLEHYFGIANTEIRIPIEWGTIYLLNVNGDLIGTVDDFNAPRISSKQMASLKKLYNAQQDVQETRSR